MTGDAPVRIALTGATGRTGNAVAWGLADRADVQLVACVAPSVATTPTRPLPAGCSTAATLEQVGVAWDVLVDLTHAGAAEPNVELAIARGAHVVLGTTGVADDELARLGQLAADAGVGLLYVPNFAIGAVLMMRFAADAARYLPSAEIIELHHDGKRDAPSGTARRTAELVGAALAAAGAGSGADAHAGAPARGEAIAGVQVHSMRLQGAVAHQEVVLGGPGELLTIRHDAIDRSCYAAGVALAARGVASFTGLETGLEHVL